MTTLTDGQAVKIAREIRRLNDRIFDLAAKLHNHPNGEEMYEALFDNSCITPASAEAVISDHLSRPERWHLEHGMSLVFGRADIQHG